MNPVQCWLPRSLGSSLLAVNFFIRINCVQCNFFIRTVWPSMQFVQLLMVKFFVHALHFITSRAVRLTRAKIPFLYGKSFPGKKFLFPTLRFNPGVVVIGQPRLNKKKFILPLLLPAATFRRGWGCGGAGGTGLGGGPTEVKGVGRWRRRRGASWEGRE